MTQDTNPAPVEYGIIGVQSAQWRRGWTWLLPAFALGCGVVASGRLNGMQIVPILVAMLIVVGLWPPFWTAVAETDWAAPLSRWRAWDKGESLKPLPYAVPGSDADQLVIVLGKFRAWANEDMLPDYGAALTVALSAPTAALILSAVLGAPALELTIVALCLAQIRVLAARGNGAPNPLLRGVIHIALPLLLGVSLLRVIPVELIVVAVGFAVAHAGMVAGRAWTSNIGLAIVLAALVVTRHSVGVFGVGLLWLPQFLGQAQPTQGRGRWWLYASMFVAALTLG